MTTPRPPGADRQADAPDEAYDDGRLRVEHDNYYVTCDGRLLSLPRKEFLILSRLAQSAGRVVPSDALRRYAWGDRAAPPPRACTCTSTGCAAACARSDLRSRR